MARQHLVPVKRVAIMRETERAPKSSNKAKDQVLSTTVTLKMMIECQQQAAEEGLSVSEWLRGLIELNLG